MNVNTIAWIVVTAALAVTGIAGWSIYQRNQTAAAPAAADVAAGAPAPDMAAPVAVDRAAETAALERQRDAALAEAEEARRQLQRERAARATPQQATIEGTRWWGTQSDGAPNVGLYFRSGGVACWGHQRGQYPNCELTWRREGDSGVYIVEEPGYWRGTISGNTFSGTKSDGIRFDLTRQ